MLLYETSELSCAVIQAAGAALRSLECKELYQLPLNEKLILLKLLCFACYDTSAVRHMLARHAEERINQTTALLNSQKNKKRKIMTESAALKERALEECRRINKLTKKGKSSATSEDGANGTNAQKKTKNIYDPTPSQLSSMVEDMRLRQSLGFEEVFEEYPTDLVGGGDPPPTQSRSSVVSSTRVLGAETEKRRKEQELAKLMREDACHYLEQALESKRERDVRDSIKYAKNAGLEGKLDDGRTFCTALLFQVELLE